MLYKNCSDLPISNFDIIYRTNNYMYLVLEYDGYVDVKVPKEANERWQEIKKEWVSMIDDNELAYYHQLLLETIYLQTRYNIVKELLYIVWQSELDEQSMEIYINALGEWRYNWNRKNKKDVEIKRLLQQWKSSENKINLKLDELKRIQEDNDFDQEATSIEKQAVILEHITGIKLDIFKDSIKKMVEVSKLANDINEQRRKSNGK